GKEIDVYALGIILHEMLTGTVPFDGESSQEILMKHLTAEPEVSGLPEPYRAVVARALAKDPAARFADAQELYAAAQGASLFAGIVAEGDSPLPPRDPEPAPGEKAETSLTEEPPLPEPS